MPPPLSICCRQRRSCPPPRWPRPLGLAVKNAIRLLDSLVTAGVAVEVTRRSQRRLFGLKGMAPLGEAVRPP
jgi:hypothetical protein